MQEPNENTRISAALSRLAVARSPSTCHNQPDTSLCSSREAAERHGALRSIKLLSWVCSACDQACIPIRSESRCLCGHRLKEHEKPSSTGICRCSHAKCVCKSFFFIPAEGSWILRCRCKHRHTDHDPVSHACCNSGCACDVFHSPWVCNCGHAWSQHQQVLVKKEVPSIACMMAGTTPDVAVLAELASSTDANQWGLVNRRDTA